MALQLWESLQEAIKVYTGLSPAAFFTLLAIGLVLFNLVSGFFGSSDDRRRRGQEEEEEKVEPLPPPVQLGEIPEEELKQYDGSDPKKPLLMAIKGQIYDVSRGRMFYGPGGPYALFAGRDASRALAKMSFDEKDITGDISGLGPFELDALSDWEFQFSSKYVKVGTVKKLVPVTDEASSAQVAEEAANTDDEPKPSGERVVANAAEDGSSVVEETHGGETKKE